MKYISFKYFLLVSISAFLLVGSSCKKLENFEDTNVNPNGSLTPITAALLTNAQIQLGTIIAGTASGGVRAGLYAQYFAETQYTEASLYQEPKLDFAGLFAGPLMDLQQIINKNTDPATKESVIGSGSNANQIATATILKTYFIWAVTDRWGDVPYAEALQGAANFSPKYDEQMAIYTKMLADLKAAIAGFDAGTPMKGDIMYSGDQGKWKKLANTLRMFIALRMSKIYPNPGQLAATEFALAENDVNGSIESNEENFTINYPGGSFKNAWFNIYDGRKDYGFSKTIADIMTNMGDARKAAFSSNNTAFPYGLTRDDAVAFTNSVADVYAKVLADANRTENAPLNVVNVATSLLARAEAVERGWIAGNAAALYTAGITKSFEQWGVDAAAPAYIASPQVNYLNGTGGGVNIGSNAFNSIVGADAVTATPLQRIALQRYLAHYPDGIQGWSEWRRTGVPNLKPSAFAVNSPGKQIPRRYVYATNEYSLNPTQVAIAVARLTGGDLMSSKMWWDN
jgi:hypothetical protein